ncbi:MAG: tetratricopeptide repeat protein [Gemmatimonadota bacterium]|nr:MAG: tetratricopeptide repeat protein [Gemmatimonadota bacterium]
MSSFLQRLKERKLFQWALAYLAGAWLVLQAMEVTAEPFGWPLALQRGITILLVVGFFVALVVAWYHGEKGRQRVSGPELLMIAALLGIAAILLAILRPEAEAPATPYTGLPVEGEKPAIAVLPFDNFSPDPDDAYFADGMHDEIITQLQRISAIKVISRTSVMQYREARPPARQIAQALRVDFLLEGSARKDEEQVRLTVQLIDARVDEHVWAENYDRDLSAARLFEIQDDVARRVAESLAARLSPEESRRIEAQPTDNLAAYELYMLGRYHFHTRRTTGRDGLERAAEFFRLAIEADSGFALAYSGLANLCAARRFYWRYDPGASPSTRRSEMEASDSVAAWAARRAVALDSASAEAHTALGIVLTYVEHDWEAAEREFLIATELNPNHVTAYNFYGDLLLFRRRWDEAIRVESRALELDPLSAIHRAQLAQGFSGAGRLAEAVAQREAVTPHLPHSAAGTVPAEETWLETPPSHYHEFHIYYEMGRSYDDALETLVETLARTGTSPELARAYAERWGGLGWEGLWLSDLSFSASLPCHWCQAIAYERLGRKREAVDALRTAYEMSEVGLLWPFFSPFFETLDDDPQYQELLHEMGLRP